eukprot:gene1972-7421_t
MGICTPELSAVREGRRESFFIEESDIHKGGGSAVTLDGCSGAYENANLVMYEHTTLYRASTAGGEGLAQQINPTYDVNPVPPAYYTIPDDDVDDDGGGAHAYSVLNEACQDIVKFAMTSV